MLKFFKRKIKEYKCRRLAKRYCEPDKVFLNSCRETFINKLCQEIPAARVSRISLVAMWLKFSLATFCGLAFLGSGAIVYADKANVDYSHPLYSFKRLAESVRITIASSEQLPVLHSELAQRRLDEIKKIEADIVTITQEVSTTTEDIIAAQDNATTTKEVATSTKKITIKKKTQEQIEAEQKRRQELVTNLRNQMHQEVTSVIDKIEEKKVEQKSAEQLCESVSHIMKEDEEVDGDETKEKHDERWERLERNCGEFIKIDWRNSQKSNND